MSGRRVRTLFDRDAEPAEYSVPWDGRDSGGNRVGAGVYFLRLRTAAGEATGKLVVAP